MSLRLQVGLVADRFQLQPILIRRSARCPPLTQRRRTTEGRKTRRNGAEICKMGGEPSMVEWENRNRVGTNEARRSRTANKERTRVSPKQILAL